MQPKFTQRTLWYSCAKMVTLLLFLASFSQLTFAQNSKGAQTRLSEKLLMQKKAGLNNTMAGSATSVGLAPVQKGTINNQNNPMAGNPASRAFCYNGAGPFQLNKQSLLNTTLTTIGAPVAGVFPGAFAWVTTTNKLYVNDQAAPFGLYTLDTITGAKTFVVNCTGVPQANFTGMTWDASTSTMYGVSTSLAASQIFTVNITTGVCTPIGAPTAVAPGVIMLNAANSGTLFSSDIVNDNLFRWNKTTGVPTLVGPLGYNANFGQDGHFDPSDGQYFMACFNASVFQAQLRIVDTTNGSSTLVGAYAGQVETLGIFSAPTAPCSGTPNPGNTLSSAGAAACSGVPFTLSLQNNPYVVLNFQWQSSPNGTTYTNIGGANNLTYTTSQTGATYYRCNVTCPVSGITTTSNPVFVADGQGLFTSQPVNASVQCGSLTPVTFSFTATGNSLSYAWEYRINASSPWLNVTNGGVYSGATTNTLSITSPPISMNGYQYRGLISGPCTAVDFSNVATLTVTPYIVTVAPPSATICTGTIQPLTITNIVSVPVTTVFSSGAISIPIPDANAAGINHTIPVAGVSGLITDVTVRFSIPAHTWPGDLAVVLKAPNGNILSLDYFITATGAGPGPGMVNTKIGTSGVAKLNTSSAPYSGPIFAPDAQLVPSPALGNPPVGPTGYNTPLVNSFGGLTGTPNGNWTLAIYDAFGGDIGNLTNWQISFTYVAPVFAQGVWTAAPAAPNTMFNDALATIPYVAGTPQTTIYVNPTVNTNYSVVVTTATCVSPPTVVPVNVTNPITGLATPANKTACVGTNTSFSVSPGGGPLTYQWQVSVDGGVTYNNIAGATAATLNLTAVTQLMNNNLYRVTVNASPCGAITTAAGKLTVNQLPVVTISSTTLQLVPGRIATLTGSSSPAPFSATSWSWTRNGSTIAGVTVNNVTANIDQQGAYRATVTDINGCVNSSNIVTIGSEASEHLWIYPNPNTGQFQVRLYYNQVIGERRIVRIYNMLGQLVAQKAFDLDSNTPHYLSLNFDLGIQSGGTYVVKVVDANSRKITSGLVVIQ